MKILNHKKEIVFELDREKKTYKFYNKGFASEFENGVWIPPYAQPSLGNRKVIYPPKQTDKNYDHLFKLFEGAVRFYHRTELCKSNFELTD